MATKDELVKEQEGLQYLDEGLQYLEKIKGMNLVKASRKTRGRRCKPDSPLLGFLALLARSLLSSLAVPICISLCIAFLVISVYLCINPYSFHPPLLLALTLVLTPTSFCFRLFGGHGRLRSNREGVAQHESARHSQGVLLRPGIPCAASLTQAELVPPSTLSAQIPRCSAPA
eukprot:2567573-Rhodomonas_salina.2